MLHDISVLVVEDEPFTALAIGMEVEEANGHVIGPAASVAEATKLIKNEEVHGAILDLHLIDGDVAPIATRLFELGVPFLFHCGVGLTPALKAQHPNVAVYLKPTAPSRLVKAIAALVRN
jgi:DNA-binding response OmpR family regulator